jgi:hypothetical protein
MGSTALRECELLDYLESGRRGDTRHRLRIKTWVHRTHPCKLSVLYHHGPTVGHS